MLDQDTVYVWRVQLNSSGGYAAEQIALWRGLVSKEELRRADRFHAEGHRRDFLCAHAALRRVLGGCLNLPAALVEFVAPSLSSESEGGAGTAKPALAYMRENGGADARKQDLRFNLSHTLGAALVAVSVGREVGVDIEWQRPLDEMEGMARTVFSGEEMAEWSGLEREEQQRSFYNVWSRKEAYLKAIGLGLYRSLQDVTVPVLVQRLDQPRRVQDASDADWWWVQDVPVEGEYSASVCWEGEPGMLLKVVDLPMDGEIADAPRASSG